MRNNLILYLPELSSVAECLEQTAWQLFKF